jgi:predicted nucleic acid-binding protein
MNVLIDTNVILDIFLHRELHYDNAMKINILSEKGQIRAYVSSSVITDIYYIAEKELKDRDLVIRLLKNLLKTVRVASVTEDNIYEALDLKWADFEDSVQYVAGQSIFAEYIITRNPNDFADGKIKILLPEEFLSQVILREN